MSPGLSAYWPLTSTSAPGMSNLSGDSASRPLPSVNVPRKSDVTPVTFSSAPLPRALPLSVLIFCCTPASVNCPLLIVKLPFS